MLTAAQLKSLLRAQQLRLSTRLGQHHLVDGRTIAQLARRWILSPADTVVEVGAGLGALTEPLAERAGQVIAVEIDPRIAEVLRERLGARSNVRVVAEDILTFPWESHPGVVAVGAIPYQITSPILIALWEHRRTVREAWLILQREVAQRLLARPGTKAYSRLSVLAQYGWELERVMDVSRRAFFPQPEVDSACVHLVARRSPPVAVDDEAFFFEVVKAAFAHRRKTLANCLLDVQSRRLDREQVEELLQEIGLPASVRGETLTLEQFAALANALAHH